MIELAYQVLQTIQTIFYLENHIYNSNHLDQNHRMNWNERFEQKLVSVAYDGEDEPVRRRVQRVI